MLKRLAMVLTIAAMLCFASPAKAITDWWNAGDLIGGCDDCLDYLLSYGGHQIAIGDMAIVGNSSDGFLVYNLQDIGGEEKSPYIIDVNQMFGNERWVLVSSFSMGRSAEPAVAFRDSNCTDFDVNGKIYVNCTDTGSGTEDCDFYFQQQINGTLTTWLMVNADGNLNFQDRDFDGVGTITFENGESISNITNTVITFCADGAECVSMDLDTATDNEVAWQTSTGVNKFNFGAIALATTGTISTTAAMQGGVAISSDADGMSQGEMTAAGMYGTAFFATGAGTWNIPAAAAGMSFCLYSTTQAAVIANPDNADTITYDGTKDTAGHQIAAPNSAAGEFICMIAYDATDWYTFGVGGTWVPGS